MPQSQESKTTEATEQAFGRYRLLERLGEGGMAEVFKAKSFGVEGFEKTLVIKRILPKLAEHPKFVDMFVHEAKLAVRLSHANIVQVFDLGRVDHPAGQPTSYFIAMEYVAGLDLATLLRRCRKQKTPVPFGLAVFVAAEVAKALDHAHRRRDEQSRPLGIVHRDVSPQNILLSWEGEAKVTDFGIAKAKDSIDAEEEQENREGKIKGKLAYMSPEQTRAEPLDGRSDLFSLGVVLYELIVGSNPFAAPTPLQTLRRVQACEFPPLELARPETPAPLIQVAKKLLAKDRDDRFADAGKLHEELLGYFYATNDRFGSNNLAEFLEPFQEVKNAPDIVSGVVFEDEGSSANDRTPVEVPSPTTGTGQRAGGSGSFKVDTGALPRIDASERREVTALVVSFSERPRDAAPRVTMTPPGAATQRAREVLARYGARVVEEESNQIVALFGLGDADGRDTDAAVRAGLVILRGSVATSAGVHVARVVVDAGGEPVKDDRLTNLVAAAQALARATDGQLVVSPLAARIIRSDFTTDDLPTSSKTASSTSGRIVTFARRPSDIYGRFVGRHDELKRLGDILAGATKRRAQLVFVEGDKGIGKTRLLAEMERRLGKGNYNVGFYVATCPKNGADVPWSGLRAMLQVLCGIQEGDEQDRILDVLPRLRALGLQPDQSSAVLAQLGASSSEMVGVSANESSAMLRAAFTRMVQSLCDDRLHVLAWDDAQAIDPATLDAIVATLDRSHARGDASSQGGGLRAMFMIASREDLAPRVAGQVAEWASRPRAPAAHSIRLAELNDEDGAKLIGTRAGARVLGPEVLAFFRERAGGHPLFLEELVRELVDSGALSVMNGQVVTNLDASTLVPRTLRTLIASRVSRLDVEARALVQATAILGDPIPTQVLATLLGLSLSVVDRTIAQLASRDLLRVTGPELASFASPMHGEIVLDTIPPEARRELHARAAGAYVATLGEDGEHVERIAHHLYEAGDRDRAASAYARAAEQKSRTSLEVAIRLMLRALDLADLDGRSAAEIAGWLRILSSAVSRCRVAPNLSDAATRALRRIDLVGDLDTKVRARIDVARALGSTNQFDEAYRTLDEANTLARGDDELRSIALGVETEIAARSGDFARAKRASQDLVSAGGTMSAGMLLNLAHASAAAGEVETALNAIDRAAALDAPTDLEAATEREKARVLVYIYSRNYAKAVEASVRAVDLARSTGVRFALAAALHNLGDAYRRLGELPRAYASFSESRDIASNAGHERLAMLNRVHLAYLDGLSGQRDAEALLRDLLRYAESRAYWTDALEARWLLGALLQHRGALDAAKLELEQVRDLAVLRGNNLIAEDAREILARAAQG